MNTEKKLSHEQEIIALGKKAYLEGLPQSANPYVTGMPDENLWNVGWLQGDNAKAKVHDKILAKTIKNYNKT